MVNSGLRNYVFLVETILNIYTQSLGKMQNPFILKLVVRTITTWIYRVKEALVTPGLHGNFWSGGDNIRDVMKFE